MQLISKQNITNQLNKYNYSQNTVVIYQSWILRFVKYHHLENDQFDLDHIEKYLTHLLNKKLKVSTHNQALNSILFFYQKILKISIKKNLISTLRVNHKQNLPDILSKKQVESIICHLKDTYQLITYLLYGCGLRSSEALELKIKDINFDTNQLTVANPKYFRTLLIPIKIISDLKCQIKVVKKKFEKDVKSKYFCPMEQDKCYLFPMKQLCNNTDGLLIRLPIISNTLNYNLALAAKKAKITIKISTQTFRYSYAVYLLQNKIDLKTVQKLLGHKYIGSTLIYSYAAQKESANKSLLSPLDVA